MIEYVPHSKYRFQQTVRVKKSYLLAFKCNKNETEDCEYFGNGK